ncbi:MAG: hypothetical protein Q9172_004734 [Xanthocarpia lactea]
MASRFETEKRDENQTVSASDGGRRPRSDAAAAGDWAWVGNEVQATTPQRRDSLWDSTQLQTDRQSTENQQFRLVEEEEASFALMTAGHERSRRFGDTSRNDTHIVVSTVAEAEHLLSYLIEAQDRGKSVNVLYGLPVPPSTVQRLAYFGKRLLPGSVSVLVDHHDQLQHLKKFKEISGYPLSIFIKVDTGYHRAGVPRGSVEFSKLLTRILDDEDVSTHLKLLGLYSHAGHSYGASSASQAMDMLIEEIDGLRKASQIIKRLHPTMAHQQLNLSVGATPSATSIQNLVDGPSPSALGVNRIEAFRKSMHRVKANHDILELHAGVYPFLDMQQLATQAGPSASKPSTGLSLSFSDIAFTVLTEVGSLYSERDPFEALIAAGTFALGREPCNSYSGWGIVSNWGIGSTATTGRSGWQVSRISQEHGILTQELPEDVAELSVGQKLRVYPNHACVAGAGFDYYLAVDSDLPENRHNEILEVWVRCRGW